MIETCAGGKPNTRLDGAILRAEHAAMGAMFGLVALNILAGVVRERPMTALGLTVLAGMIIGRRPAIGRPVPSRYR